uniref:Uncharacterized protein n=1 Tax=Cacopsylla melanoneura TaxID=428564 RepID=A0A8D8Z7S9_9HEMI
MTVHVLIFFREIDVPKRRRKKCCKNFFNTRFTTHGIYLLNQLTFFLSLHNTKVQNLLFPYQITQIFYLIRTEKKASTTFLFPLVIRLSDDGMQIRHGFFLCFIFFSFVWNFFSSYYTFPL